MMFQVYFLFMCMYVCLDEFICTIYVQVLTGPEVVGSLGSGVTGGWKPPEESAGYQSCISSKISRQALQSYHACFVVISGKIWYICIVY